MDKFYLFLEFYQSNNEDRQKELVECLEKNVSSGLFHKIFCFTELKENEIPNIDINTIVWICKENRSTFYDIVKHINKMKEVDIDSLTDNYYVIANADIIFNDTLLQAPNLFEKLSTPSRPLCMAITRHNIKEQSNGSVEYVLHRPSRESQDCWIFRDTIIDIPDSNFYFGVPGCDNRLVAILRRASYNVINPCKIIQIIHNHKTEYRTYTNKDRIRGAYAFVDAYNG